MGSNDSGAPPGALHVFDVKDPRNPKLLKTVFGTPETAKLRELHAMPVALLNGKDYLVFPSTGGLQFFDFTDPMNPTPSGSIALAGVNGGDYDNAAWMLSWSWPYVFAGGTGNGIFIVDATDPAHPVEIPRIATGRSATSAWARPMRSAIMSSPREWIRARPKFRSSMSAIRRRRSCSAPARPPTRCTRRW